MIWGEIFITVTLLHKAVFSCTHNEGAYGLRLQTSSTPPNIISIVLKTEIRNTLPLWMGAADCDVS